MWGSVGGSYQVSSVKVGLVRIAVLGPRGVQEILLRDGLPELGQVDAQTVEDLLVGEVEEFIPGDVDSPVDDHSTLPTVHFYSLRCCG